MASYSWPPAAQERRHILAQTRELEAISKATRRSDCIRAASEKSFENQTDTRLRSQYSTKQETCSNPEQSHSGTREAKKRSWDPANDTSTERPRKRLHTQKPFHTKQATRERLQEEEAYVSRISPESSSPQLQTSTIPAQKTIVEARIDFWRERGTWPTEEQETAMRRFRELVDDARAQKRSLSRKRSNASLNSDTTQTQTSSYLQSQDQKSATYKHPLFEEQLGDCGSFMDDHTEGITAESEELCQMLLRSTQSPPEHTLFSDDDLFKKICKRISGANKTKVVRDIAPLIVPSAEILADSGAKHLEILRETVDACWVNSTTFMKPPGSRPGPRSQPDFGLGFKREAFGREQLQKLQPFIGDVLTDSTLIAATYNMYLPFFSAEVKCGGAVLDIADRQNAHTQSVILRGLYTLFRLAGREEELHREINGFSISHSDECVRICGHYAVIDGDDVKYYRHPIRSYNITELNGRERWTAYTFVRNIYDLWLPKHFDKICHVIDSLPSDLNFDVSEQGLEEVSDSQPSREPSVQPITPDTTIRTGSPSLRKGGCYNSDLQ